jgi:hypothetical protein
MSAKVAELLGYLLPPWALCFQKPDGLSPAPSPEPSRVRVHPPTNAASPSEYVPTCHLLNIAAERLPWGLAPLRDISLRSSLTAEFPKPDYVSSSAFPTLPTTYSCAYLVGLFHPTATSGICTPRAFLATKPPRLIIETCPHVVSVRLLPAGEPPGARSTHPAFRALIRVAIRCSSQVV